MSTNNFIKQKVEIHIYKMLQLKQNKSVSIGAECVEYPRRCHYTV